MAATLKDVARQAGVSVSAASLVLSGKADGRIATITAERIRLSAADLGYRGNRIARSLRQQSTSLLGLLSIGVATQPYAGTMLEAAQATARLHDLDILFLEIPDERAIAASLRLLDEHQVSGTVIASFFHQQLTLPAMGTAPVVLMDASCRNLSADSVVPDEYASESAAMDEIARFGHRDVGWICERPHFPAAHLRTRAFADKSVTFGWNQDPRRVVLDEGTDAKAGFRATEQLLDQYPEVTAVACYTDRMAMGAYMACFERGIRIPEDLSIVGFDDQLLISEALRPGLTTVSLPHRQMGEWAVNRLIERVRITQELAPSQVQISGELVIRDSVAPPRTGPVMTSARR